MHCRELTKPDGRALYLYSRSPIDRRIVATNPPHPISKPNPHLRWHPLRGEWVVYASHRQDRTFLPPKEYSPLAVSRSAEFPTELPQGEYDVAVFDNLFPSLTLSGEDPEREIVSTRPARGHCDVVVFTQNPDTSLGGLPVDHIALILEVLGERTRELGSRKDIQYVLPFENRGVEVGVTLHHPHGQIYSYSFIPPVVARMQKMAKEHFSQHHQSLFSDLIAEELNASRRVIARRASALAFVPVCARYPYETWVAPIRSVPYLYELEASERRDLAVTLKTVLSKYDRMWNRPFPYLLTLYQAPTDGEPHPEAHSHFQIYPPYRTRDKLKFLAGTELAAGVFVNDSLPEEKARELIDVECPVYE